MLRAYLFALDPTPGQVEQFRSHAGGARYAYNWAVGRVLANWDQRRAEESYGIPEAERTPWVSTSSVSLNNAFNAAKDDVAPWNRLNSSRIYNTAMVNASQAFANRMAGHARRPHFKSKRAPLSFQFAAEVRLDGRRHVKLPTIGLVHVAHSTRKLARLVEQGRARIKTCTVSWQRGRWHISMLAEVEQQAPPARTKRRVVGIDLGIKALAALSTGEIVDNPRHLEGDLAELRRAQRVASRRRGPDRRTKTPPSSRWRKANARVQRIQTRIAARRRDHLHKLTARLVREHDVLVVEDLAVRNLMRNHRLARHIAGASWGELRRQLTYKAEWTGATFVVADRWTPSSKTCSSCGTVKAKLALSERTYHCETCGLVLDRDVNAARNLAALAGKINHDTGELRREQPDGTACKTVPASRGTRQRRSPREESPDSTRHREVPASPSTPVGANLMLNLGVPA